MEVNKTTKNNLYSRCKSSLPFLILESLRPQQWTKNLFVFGAIVFSRNLLDESLLLKTIFAFLIFSFLSGSVYILNDLYDINEDRAHPVNSHRPLASSRLSVIQAIVAISLFIPFLLGLSYMINQSFFISALCYILLQTAYTFYLKHVVILDVFSTAFGFLLRVIAGAVAIQVEISSWLLICTITLSLFLALSKRRYEVAGLTAGEQRFRKVLQEYNTYLLDQMISVASSATVVLYILYTLSDETLKRFGTRKLVYTVPPVLFGIFRYLYLIHKKKVGGNPETTLFNDLPLFIGIIVWIALVVLILYG